MRARSDRLSRREHASHAVPPQLRRKLDAALAAAKLDVDQRQVRGSVGNEPERFGSAACRPQHPMTDIGERVGQQQAKQNFVLDDHNVHGTRTPSRSAKQDGEESSPNFLQIGDCSLMLARCR